MTATCDTFINTLDELMDLADTHFNIYAGGPLENGTRRVSFVEISISYGPNLKIDFWKFSLHFVRVRK